MADAVIYATGVVVWALLGIAALGVAVSVVCKLINKAVWRVLDCYGGFKTFEEYRRWYHNPRTTWGGENHD